MTSVEPIQNEGDYDAALARVTELMDDLSGPDGQIVDVADAVVCRLGNGVPGDYYLARIVALANLEVGDGWNAVLGLDATVDAHCDHGGNNYQQAGRKSFHFQSPASAT